MNTHTKTGRRVPHGPATRCKNKSCTDCYLSDGEALDTWAMDKIAGLCGQRSPHTTLGMHAALKAIRHVVVVTGRKPERRR